MSAYFPIDQVYGSIFDDGKKTSKQIGEELVQNSWIETEKFQEYLPLRCHQNPHSNTHSPDFWGTQVNDYTLAQLNHFEHKNANAYQTPGRPRKFKDTGAGRGGFDIKSKHLAVTPLEIPKPIGSYFQSKNKDLPISYEVKDAHLTTVKYNSKRCLYLKNIRPGIPGSRSNFGPYHFPVSPHTLAYSTEPYPSTVLYVDPQKPQQVFLSLRETGCPSTKHSSCRGVYNWTQDAPPNKEITCGKINYLLSTACEVFFYVDNEATQVARSRLQQSNIKVITARLNDLDAARLHNLSNKIVKKPAVKPKDKEQDHPGLKSDPPHGHRFSVVEPKNLYENRWRDRRQVSLLILDKNDSFTTTQDAAERQACEYEQELKALSDTIQERKRQEENKSASSNTRQAENPTRSTTPGSAAASAAATAAAAAELPAETAQTPIKVEQVAQNVLMTTSAGAAAATAGTKKSTSASDPSGAAAGAGALMTSTAGTIDAGVNTDSVETIDAEVNTEARTFAESGVNTETPNLAVGTQISGASLTITPVMAETVAEPTEFTETRVRTKAPTSRYPDAKTVLAAVASAAAGAALKTAYDEYTKEPEPEPACTIS